MVLMAVLFFSVQSLSTAHAAAHGELDHSHEGVACDLTVIAAEKVVLSSPEPETAPLPRVIKARLIAPVSDRITHGFDGRAPPPRAPPL